MGSSPLQKGTDHCPRFPVRVAHLERQRRGGQRQRGSVLRPLHHRDAAARAAAAEPPQARARARRLPAQAVWRTAAALAPSGLSHECCTRPLPLGWQVPGEPGKQRLRERLGAVPIWSRQEIEEPPLDPFPFCCRVMFVCLLPHCPETVSRSLSPQPCPRAPVPPCALPLCPASALPLCPVPCRGMCAPLRLSLACAPSAIPPSAKCALAGGRAAHWLGASSPEAAQRLHQLAS
jgi:hypothetical protein